MPTPREILRKVRQIEIRTNRLVTDALTGAYHSVFKGQGMDFEEVREYAPGDDVRAIDWNVTAKMDRPFIKKFREERELTIVLLVDLSASGAFGSEDESKRELAAEIASVLAFSATKNNDKVGLMLFTDEVEQYIPPRKGRQHVLRVIREILFHEPQHTGTNVVMALDTVNRMIKRKAIVFLLTDFLQGPDGRLPAPNEHNGDALFRALALTNRRHDLTTILLSDPREVQLPNVGLIALEDAETGQLVEIDTGSSKVRSLYAKQNRERLDGLHKGLRQAGVGALPVCTGEPYINNLRRYFEARSQRRH
ncbi:DUF58 domain-containing protein [Cerasicoccus arenae]|uniref:DUF58 domain-containing protein n=1 Tax=Cerasicoccus arenae TaxID=424488 RepID=A0A8J3DD01_9BACT|nr:DUF58 domain-containing protein [Cerasicoccus arenae]MBK1858585.1 DUF58 domain-containing protein [Cerasicoccus arenae]GHC05150.1 DUF58 domain-containing protein [Cerasicoccus arenae]